MMGNIGFENLRPLGLALRDALNIDTFIETGTYKAQTTIWAAGEFKRVVTIEASEDFHTRAKNAHSKLKNVRFIHGDSLVEFPKVIKRLKKPALIWLDAHKCRHEKSLGDSECPLLAELAAVKGSGVEHIILIDDARLFVEPPPAPYDSAEWPTMDAVKAALPDGYQVAIWNDAIIAVPAEVLPIVHRFTDPQKLEVIVLTSNKYAHCLRPFAHLFNKFWPNQAVKVVRYDVRPPKLPPNFTNYAIGSQSDYTWSSGLLKYLNYHQGELILLMLEDYFISGAVRVEAIKGAWDLMLKNSEIAKIDLTDDRLKVNHSRWMDSDTFILSGKDAPFQTSLQAAIWRVDFLKRFLQRDENPWQFERRGSKRVIKARESGEFDGLILGFKNPPLTYINAVGGEGSHPLLWDDKKIPPWMVDELSRKGLM